MGAALVTSSRTGSAGVSGLDVTWHKGQDEGHRPLLWHSIRTPAAMRLVPDSDRLVMYSGNVSTLGSLSLSSDSSDGELPARHRRKRNSEGGRSKDCTGLHGLMALSTTVKSLRGPEMPQRGKMCLAQSGEPLLPGAPTGRAGCFLAEQHQPPHDPLRDASAVCVQIYDGHR